MGGSPGSWSRVQSPCCVAPGPNVRQHVVKATNTYSTAKPTGVYPRPPPLTTSLQILDEQAAVAAMEVSGVRVVGVGVGLRDGTHAAHRRQSSIFFSALLSARCLAVSGPGGGAWLRMKDRPEARGWRLAAAASACRTLGVASGRGGGGEGRPAPDTSHHHPPPSLRGTMVHDGAWGQQHCTATVSTRARAACAAPGHPAASQPP